MGNAQENRFLAPVKGISNTFRNFNTNSNIYVFQIILISGIFHFFRNTTIAYEGLFDFHLVVFNGICIGISELFFRLDNTLGTTPRIEETGLQGNHLLWNCHYT